MRNVLKQADVDVRYFKECRYKFDASKQMEIFDILSPKDQEIFNFDIRKLDLLEQSVVF